MEFSIKFDTVKSGSWSIITGYNFKKYYFSFSIDGLCLSKHCRP